MASMGQFHVTARLTGPTGGGEQVRLLVDTGATFLVLPRPVADRLGVHAQRMEPVITAGGREEVWPVGEVRVAIEGREVSGRQAPRPHQGARRLIPWSRAPRAGLDSLAISRR